MYKNLCRLGVQVRELPLTPVSQGREFLAWHSFSQYVFFCDPRMLFCRRLFILLLVGLIHAFGIWYGDILVVYSLTGVLLLLFSNIKSIFVLKWAWFALLVPVALIVLNVLAAEAGGLKDTAGAAFVEDNISESLAAYGRARCRKSWSREQRVTWLADCFIY